MARRAVIEAWGASGRGIRAVLTSAELARFLNALLADVDHAGLSGTSGVPGAFAAARPTGPARRGRASRPAR